MVSWLQSKGLLYFVRLGMMIVLTAFNFVLAVIRWGWAAGDVIIASSAVLVAGATEIGLFAFLILFHLEAYSSKRRSRLLAWGAAALACVGVSLYVNIGYFGSNWRDTSGNTTADLAIRALFPMALLLFFSMIPPKRLSIDDIQSAHEVEKAKTLNKLEIARIGQEDKDKRRKEREDRDAKRVQLRRIAGPELTRQFTTMDGDDNELIDWLGLEAELNLRGQLSPSGEAQPSIDKMIAIAKTATPASIRTVNKKRASTAKRTRRTSAEIMAITDAYLRGEYVPKNRQERYYLMQRASVNKSA